MSVLTPSAVLFDWHGTLVDTVDAMYRAIDDLFPRLAEQGLLERLLDPERSRSEDDAKLVNYVRRHYELHPKVKAARRLSRTDIFEVLFGGDDATKAAAHTLYDECYRAHFGDVKPYRPEVGAVLETLKQSGALLGIVSNRNREFLTQELALIDGGRWQDLFNVVVCGDDVIRRKPAPDSTIKALEQLELIDTPERCWAVGDSTTDVIAAKRAGTVAVFYNGVGWDQHWLTKIFPRSGPFPEAPDLIIRNFSDLEQLVISQRA